MRNWLRRLLPNHEFIRGNRWLAPFSNSLLHPRLWHLNRHSVAGGVAVGLFCGLIPGPLQMLGAALLAVPLRVNLPLALITTVYTNPLTIVPLYLVAFTIGQLVVGAEGQFHTPPEMNGLSFGDWIGALIDWMAGLGAPLAVGLPILGGILALSGYVVVRAAWRVHLIRRWRTRHRR